MELTDMTNGIGYLHVMYPALTTDEILLTRAEAYAMKGKYDKALADLNIWGKAFYESTSDVTVEDINTFYGTPVYDSKGKLISGMEYYTSKVATPKNDFIPTLLWQRVRKRISSMPFCMHAVSYCCTKANVGLTSSATALKSTAVPYWAVKSLLPMS